MSMKVCFVISPAMAIVVLIAMSNPVGATWTPFETFSSVTVGSALDGQNGWSAPGHGTSGSGTAAPAVRGVVDDPEFPGNNVLEYSYDGTGIDHIWRSLGDNNISDGTTSTMYMRFRVPDYALLDGNDSSDFPDMVFSLRPGAVTSSGSRPMGPHLRIQGVDNDNTAVMSVRPSQYDASGSTASDPGWIDLDAPKLDTDTWYNLWFVTNSTTDTFELYIQGGSFASQTQLSYDDGGTVTDIAFRDLENTGGTATLDHIWFRAGANHDGGRMLMDHIFFDKGENLTLPPPVPEPGTVVLAILALIGLIPTGRRPSR